MKIFNFTGFGNYSHTFGWDNGMDVTLGNLISLEDALAHEEWCANDAPACCGTPLNQTCDWGRLAPTKGVYESFLNSHGGTRNMRGFVVADSKQEAEKIIADYASRFEITEYER